MHLESHEIGIFSKFGLNLSTLKFEHFCKKFKYKVTNNVRIRQQNNVRSNLILFYNQIHKLGCKKKKEKKMWIYRLFGGYREFYIFTYASWFFKEHYFFLITAYCLTVTVICKQLPSKSDVYYQSQEFKDLIFIVQ